MGRGFVTWALVASTTLAADAVTKAWALRHAQGWPPLHPLPGLRFTVTYNTGSAFGLGHGTPPVGTALLVLAAGVCASLLWLARRWIPTTPAAAIPLGLALGGAAGNLADRVLRTVEPWGELPQRAVVDFIVVGTERAAWPAFNVADIALTIALPWLVVIAFRRADPPEGGA